MLKDSGMEPLDLRETMYEDGIDHYFDLILPTFETSVSDGLEKGRFEDIVVNQEVLSKKDLSSRYTYDSVLWKTLGNFRNIKAENDKRYWL